MTLRTITQLPKITNKTVLVRVDFNVPIKHGKILNNQRIKEALPTIKYLLAKQAKVIIISHLGRPVGWEHKYSLKLVVVELAKLLNRPVVFANCNILQQSLKLKAKITVLENIRFYPAEEKNDLPLAKALANLADFFIFDAFGTAHRSGASTTGVARYLPAYAGLLVEKEVNRLHQAMARPKHPAIAIIGGVKISDKIAVIKNLLKKFDHVLIGGALANNFFKAQGINIKKSICEPKKISLAKKLLNNKKLIVPSDYILGCLNNQKMILDIGPQTVADYAKLIKQAKTIVWNGPLGLFEQPPFDRGTKQIAKAVWCSHAQVIIGGGETLTAIKNLKPKNNIFLSTGGGAMLKFLTGKTLPAIKPLIK